MACLKFILIIVQRKKYVNHFDYIRLIL